MEKLEDQKKEERERALRPKRATACFFLIHHDRELTMGFFPLHTDLPPVKPSAIALGTVFSHGVELAVMAPLFGQTYQRAKAANTKEEFIKSKEAAGAAVAWGTSFVGAGLQSYGVAALINATGTLSYKGAAYLGGLIFAATAAPGVS